VPFSVWRQWDGVGLTAAPLLLNLRAAPTLPQYRLEKAAIPRVGKREG